MLGFFEIALVRKIALAIVAIEAITRTKPHKPFLVLNDTGDRLLRKALSYCVELNIVILSIDAPHKEYEYKNEKMLHCYGVREAVKILKPRLKSSNIAYCDSSTSSGPCHRFIRKADLLVGLPCP